MDVHFVREPIVVPALVPDLREVGACVEFHGIVREQEEERALTGLRYEAYEVMARTEFARIHAELAVKFSISAATVIHRIGWVPVGEASLYVRVLAKHRGAALGYCGELIDRMKQDVPIWKAE